MNNINMQIKNMNLDQLETLGYYCYRYAKRRGLLKNKNIKNIVEEIADESNEILLACENNIFANRENERLLANTFDQSKDWETEYIKIKDSVQTECYDVIFRCLGLLIALDADIVNGMKAKLLYNNTYRKDNHEK